MLWAIGLPLVLLLVPLLVGLGVYLAALPRPTAVVTVLVWRHGRWTEDRCFVHYPHWLPRALDVSGFSIGRHIWLKRGPPQGPGIPASQRHQVAHECGHLVDWLINPDSEVALAFVWGWIAHLRNKRAQPREKFAYSVQAGITRGDSAWLRFPDNWLILTFPDNYGDPHDKITERRERVRAA